jgi:hypothetical protein
MFPVITLCTGYIYTRLISYFYVLYLMQVFSYMKQHVSGYALY